MNTYTPCAELNFIDLIMHWTITGLGFDIRSCQLMQQLFWLCSKLQLALFRQIWSVAAWWNKGCRFVKLAIEYCCTPKFSLSFCQDSPHKTYWTQDQIRVCSAQDLILRWWPEIRVLVCTRNFGPSMYHDTFILHFGPLILLIPSFKPWNTFWTSQLDK